MKRLLLFLEKFHRNEAGAVESIQIVIIIGFAALMAAFLIFAQVAIDHWSQGRVQVILMEEENEAIPDAIEDFEIPDWADPSRY